MNPSTNLTGFLVNISLFPSKDGACSKTVEHEKSRPPCCSRQSGWPPFHSNMAICNPGIWALTLTFDPAAGCKHKHVLAEVNGLAVTSLRCSQCHFISACKCTWVEFVGRIKRFQRLAFFTLTFYVCVLMTFSLAGTRGSGTICQIFILLLYHIYIIWRDFPIQLGGFFPSQL